MPTSIILNLHAQENGRIPSATGRAVHGFWFQQWKATNPSIADTLHQPTDVQPFTLSPLMGLPRPKKGSIQVKKGDAAWIRIAALSDTLTQPLLESWLPRLPAQIELADKLWNIRTIALSPKEHHWAKQQQYNTLSDNAALATQWQFEFHTPATFRLGKKSHLPFPLPGVLLSSWMRRWNTFAPIPMPDSYRERFREELFVSSYRLKTVPVRYGRRLTIGCVGQFTLRAGKLTTTERTALSALAAYAFYCGSGAHTTQGMGMTQLTINN